MRLVPTVAIILFAATSLGAVQATAQEYLTTGDPGQVCSGAKSDVQILSGSDDVFVTREGANNATVTVCVPDDSPGNVLIQWGADHSWKNSGNFRNSCAVIQQATAVKVRAVPTNFHDTATYYTCEQ
jgi:hypothetical protein